MGESKLKLAKREEMLLSSAGLQTMAGRVQLRWDTESTATPLGQLVDQRRPEAVRPQVSGFALIASARDAFAARLALTQQATRTLDIQYYAIHADPSAAELLRTVRAAARRGVRVRILLDDFNSAGHNALVMRMASVPGVQMRMFNPLPGDRGLGMLRALGSLHDFQRIQHRMHNKLFIADNAWGITGGRNLGDAYFGTADGSNFVDMDVLAVGEAVRDMSTSFDQYWNNPLAYPVQSLITPQELRRLRDVSTTPEQPPQADHGAAPGPAQAPAAPPWPMHHLLDTIDFGLLVLDRDARIVMANRWVRERMRSVPEPVGRRLADVWGGSIDPRLLFAVRECLEFGHSLRLSHAFHPVPLPADHRFGLPAEVQEVDATTWHVRGATSAAVGEAAAAVGVVLHELSPQTGSLEDAFLKVTSDAQEYRTTSLGGTE